MFIYRSSGVKEGLVDIHVINIPFLRDSSVAAPAGRYVYRNVEHEWFRATEERNINYLKPFRTFMF